jgi:DNA end-binding protein Ku
VRSKRYVTQSTLVEFPMPQRALWNGFLKLSLVSCPITLFAATAAEKRLSFRRVNRTTGNALRHQLVDAITGASVPTTDVGRGYQVEAQRFLLVDDQEIEDARKEARERPFSSNFAQEDPNRVFVDHSAKRSDEGRGGAGDEKRSSQSSGAGGGDRVEPVVNDAPAPVPRPINNKTIDLDRFIDRQDLDIRFADAPYYIVPRDETGEEAFAVVREAMRDRGMAGMGRVVLQKRERPIIVLPLDKGLIGVTLRFSHEIRDTSEFFGVIPDIDLPEDMVEMAALLIDRKSGVFDPAFLEDRYRTVMVERLQRKSNAKPTEGRANPAREQNVIDLMAALKRSVGREQPTQKTPTKRAATQRAAARAKQPPTKKSGRRRG